MFHPLDFPVWSALSGRQARFAMGPGPALRYDPAVNVFVAVADRSPESLAALSEVIRAHGDAALIEEEGPPEVTGVITVSVALGVQMVEVNPSGPAPADFSFVDLTSQDAPQMLALAEANRPGPFFLRTPELGGFVGVKAGGRLIAMAGERMRPEGFTEVSGVCTDPDARGRGLAANLTKVVAGRIRARGETPFLHAYASNTGAISLYESLGFKLRREVLMSRLAPA